MIYRPIRTFLCLGLFIEGCVAHKRDARIRVDSRRRAVERLSRERYNDNTNIVRPGTQYTW